MFSVNFSFFLLVVFIVCGDISAMKRSPRNIMISRRPSSSRIINGIEADPHEFPFMAMLTEYSGWQYCGGSLIDPNWILTAAHCVEGTPPEDVYIRLGSHNKYYPTDVEQVIQVDQITLHEDYIAWNLTNDIALLHLSTPAIIRQEVQQACIYHADDSFKDETLMAIGWGTTDVGTGETSDVLMKLVKIGVGENDCIELMSPIGLDHALYRGSLCAYGGAHGSDVCFGDSGSPLVWKDWYGGWRQVGLTSWGFCATMDVPAVYTRVSHFFNWILKNAVDAKIC